MSGEVPRTMLPGDLLEESHTLDADPSFAAFGIEESEDIEGQLWPGDTGRLPYDARRTLLKLVCGPLITADRHSELWQALINNLGPIKARLADMFLELVVDRDAGVAFVRNAVSEDMRLPKSVRSLPLTLVDTILILTLRKELLMDSANRVFVGREETIEQLANYRPVTRLDESAFKDKLEKSWGKLVKAGILQPIETEARCEISPVLKLVFGVDEVKAVNAEFERMLEDSEENSDSSLPEDSDKPEGQPWDEDDV